MALTGVEGRRIQSCRPSLVNARIRLSPWLLPSRMYRSGPFACGTAGVIFLVLYPGIPGADQRTEPAASVSPDTTVIVASAEFPPASARTVTVPWFIAVIVG